MEIVTSPLSLWCAEHEAGKLNHIVQHSSYIIKCCYIALQSLFQTSLTKGYDVFAFLVLQHLANVPISVPQASYGALQGHSIPLVSEPSHLEHLLSLAPSRYINFFLSCFHFQYFGI